jgi:V-type H+-transporting ATPase subunit C
MQVKTAEYLAVKQMSAAASRKTGGSLAVKDLKTLVKKEDIVGTENLATIIVTVPNYGIKQFAATYESWCDMVVPRSAKTIAEDGDYALKRVVLFKRFVDDFKQAARTKGCPVRCQALCLAVVGIVSLECC